MSGSSPPRRLAVRVAVAILFLAVGGVHLAMPSILVPIVPSWVPRPRLVVLVTGGCEIAGGLALLTERLRRAAGMALALYAVCVYPANIKDALYNLPIGEVRLGWWFHAPRLALQPVLVWLPLFAGGIIDWPFRRG